METMKNTYVHHKETSYTVYFTVEDKTFMAIDKDGMILYPPPAEINPYL